MFEIILQINQDSTGLRGTPYIELSSGMCITNYNKYVNVKNTVCGIAYIRNIVNAQYWGSFLA